MGLLAVILVSNLGTAAGALLCAAWVLSVATRRPDLFPRTLAVKLLVVLALFAAGNLVRAYEYLVGVNPRLDLALGVCTAGVVLLLAVRLWTRRRGWTHLPSEAELAAMHARADRLAVELAARDGLDGATARAKEQIDRFTEAADWQAMARAAGWTPPAPGQP